MSEGRSWTSKREDGGLIRQEVGQGRQLGPVGYVGHVAGGPEPRNFHWMTHVELYSANMNAFFVSEKFVLVWLAWGGGGGAPGSVTGGLKEQGHQGEGEGEGRGVFSWLPRETLGHVFSFVATVKGF
jgi:hypothetical protein